MLLLLLIAGAVICIMLLKSKVASLFCLLLSLYFIIVVVALPAQIHQKYYSDIEINGQIKQIYFDSYRQYGRCVIINPYSTINAFLISIDHYNTPIIVQIPEGQEFKYKEYNVSPPAQPTQKVVDACN